VRRPQELEGELDVTKANSTRLPASLPAAAAICLCVAVAGLVPAAPARGDWLVTNDGGRVETQGPWKIDGKRVIFTQKDGTLSSLRLTEVDLDASKQATTAMAEEAAAAKASEATEAAPAKKPIRILTDKDFARPPAPEAAKDDAGTAKPAPDPSPGPVKVVDWKQDHNQDTHALEITGSVRNLGPDIAVAVAVNVRLFNPRGEQFAAQPASLDTRSLRPGQNTAFTAVFPDVVDFASAKIDVMSTPFLAKPPPPDAPAETTPPPR
jgi:hypothetical protein